MPKKETIRGSVSEKDLRSEGLGYLGSRVSST